jgi:hypothetical protein
MEVRAIGSATRQIAVTNYSLEMFGFWRAMGRLWQLTQEEELQRWKGIVGRGGSCLRR